MKEEKKIKEILPRNLNWLLLKYTANLMAGFYEMQSTFLSGIYKRYKSIETANIILCLAREVHLQIIRQRERNMNHDISLDNFWNNFNNISRPSQKIVSISNMTGIPKETTRRKIIGLINQNFVILNKSNKEYYWNLLSKHQNDYYNIVKNEIETLAKFAFTCASGLKLNIDKNTFNYEDSEWEFPKGKKNKNEKNYECAKRELCEETNIEYEDYDIIQNISPINETFRGENNVNYRNIISLLNLFHQF